MKAYRHDSTLIASGRTTKSPVLSSAPRVALSHETISWCAYLKWQGRGCPSGTALQDWLEAEAELKAEFSQARRG